MGQCCTSSHNFGIEQVEVGSAQKEAAETCELAELGSPVPAPLEDIGLGTRSCGQAGGAEAQRLLLPIRSVSEALAPPPPSSKGSAGEVGARAQALLRGLRAREAAALLQGQECTPDGSDAALREALQLQMHCLGDALTRLGNHPGLRAVCEDATAELGGLPDELLGVRVAASPVSARSMGSAATGKPDVLEIDFDLDDKGHRVEAVVEFLPDGSASIQWTASELPIPLAYVLCMVHEVDLLGDVVPYVHNAAMLHQFPWNAADRVVRVVSKPPVPFVKGFEAVAQRFGFDLLDTPWAGLCLVECGPQWAKPPGGGEACWRGLARPPAFQAGLKQVDVKTVVALGRPSGPKGELTTILFSAKGDLQVPRSLLPNWLIAWLVKLVGRFVFQRALEHMMKFETNPHGARLRGSGSSFYAELDRRIAEFARAKAAKHG